MSRVCPGCSSELIVRKVGAVEVQGCGDCGGIWFEAGQLSGLTRDPKAPLLEIARSFHRAFSAGDGEGTAECPGCSLPLAKHIFPSCPDMPLDVCKHCGGIWLAYGQMEAIALRAIQARTPAAPPPAARPTPPPEPIRAAPPPPPPPVRTVPEDHRIRCASCKAMNHESAPRCTSCGADLHTVGGQRRLCPNCSVTLAGITEDGTHYALCCKCSGVWLEDGRLAVYLQLDAERHAHVMSRIAAEHAAAEREAQANAEATNAVHHAPAVAPHKGQPPAAADHQPTEAHETVRFRCPSCHYEMQQHLYGSEDNVAVYVCTMCRSTWFDAGQLQAAYNLAQREGFLALHSSESEVWARD